MLLRLLLVAAVVVAVLLATYFMWRRAHLPSRLAAAGWELYLLEGSPESTRQLEVLGDKLYEPSYVCSPRAGGPACTFATYPTWRNRASLEKREGVQSRAQLREMAQARAS